MAVEVVLQKKVVKLGDAGDLVKVSDGFARNFLLVQGMAVLATIGAKKEAAKIKEQQKQERAKAKQEAQESVKKIQKLNIIIKRKAKDGKLFGSVREVDLVKALKAEGFAAKKSQVALTGEEIKQVGNYEALITLHKGVEAKIKFRVAEEKE